MACNLLQSPPPKKKTCQRTSRRPAEPRGSISLCDIRHEAARGVGASSKSQISGSRLSFFSFFSFLGTGANYNSRNRKKKPADKGQRTRDNEQNCLERTSSAIASIARGIGGVPGPGKLGSGPRKKMVMGSCIWVGEKSPGRGGSRGGRSEGRAPGGGKGGEDEDEVSKGNLAPLAPHAYIAWPSEATFLPQTSALPSPVSGFRSSILPSTPPS